MRIEKIDLSRQMYSDAKEEGLSFIQLLEKQAKKAGKFSENAELKGLDVLQQQLAARDLAISGDSASLVEDFFKTKENKILFPAVINKFVRTGMLEESKRFVILNQLRATSTGIPGNVFQGASVDLDSDGIARRVGESGEFPTVTIKFKDKTITLYKVGYKIEATYEAVRRMALNVFGVTMKVLGRNITREKVNIAVETLINGDGNSNPISSINASSAGTLSYADVVNLSEEFKYFDPSMMISGKDMRVDYLNLTEYKDKNGPDMPDAPRRCDAMPGNKIIALDTKASLHEVFEKGGSLVEVDKVIDKQLEEAVVSEVAGWEKLFTEASIMLNI